MLLLVHTEILGGECLLPCWGVSGAGTYPPRQTLKTKTDERRDGAISTNVKMKALSVILDDLCVPGQDVVRKTC